MVSSHSFALRFVVLISLAFITLLLLGDVMKSSRIIYCILIYYDIDTSNYCQSWWVYNETGPQFFVLLLMLFQSDKLLLGVLQFCLITA